MKTLIICVVAVAVSFVGVRLLMYSPHDTRDTILQRNVPPVDPVKPATSPYSDEFHIDYAFAANSLARKSKWSEEDAAWATEQLQPWPNESRPDFKVDQPGAEAWQLYVFVDTIVIDRILSGFPTDDQVLSAWDATVRQGLVNPQAYVREQAVASIMNSGFPAADLVSQIEAMQDSDPDERVRFMAQLKLKQFTGQPTDLDCPTCPTKGDG